MQHIKNTIRHGIFKSTVYIPARVPVTVFVNGPVKCYAISEAEDYEVAIPLGMLDGPVELQTCTDWTLCHQGEETVFYTAPRKRSDPAPRDPISWTSLDMPRPLTETEKLLRMQTERLARLERAFNDRPKNPDTATLDDAADQPAQKSTKPTKGKAETIEQSDSSGTGEASERKSLPDTELEQSTDKG